MKTDKINFTKVFVSTLMIVSLLAFFSCDDDDEEKVGPLVGTWTLTKEVYSNCDNPDWNETVTYNCAADVDDCLKLTFTKDNKFTYVFGDGTFSVNGTYISSGNQLTLTLSGISDVYPFTVSGTTLTITYDDGDCDVTETYTKS